MPPTLEDDHFSATLYNSFTENTPAAYSPNLSNEPWYEPAPDAPTPQSATRAIPPGPKATPQNIETLRRLPELRSIPWKAGKQIGPEKSTKSDRPQTRGAYMLVTRGEIRDPPCTNCEHGSGRFSVCVSLNEYYQGACATCVLATRGTTCTLRQDIEEGFPPQPATPQQVPIQQRLEDDDGYQQTSSLKRKRSPTRAYVAAYSQDKRGAEEQHQPQSQTTNTNNYPSYSPIQPSNTYSAAPQTTMYSPPAPSTSPESLLLNDKSALLNYVYQKQYPPNGKKRHQIIHQAERESRESSQVHIGPPSKRPRTADLDRGEPSSSMSPSIQLTQASPVSYQSAGNGAVRYGGVGEGRGERDIEMGLIDRLPKKKQREIFGIIGTIQSGIRMVRQQTDTLQKQLDLLQGALGIDLDDEDVS
ncbi:uncharacterized protein PAC_06616 [Phialocephala subalpina]|uniref:Uncharacterized protein n=1 Tax=Phialocephala subalpina TaxID=576137 RepID=A0A1L7WVD4_9HELO|nr:uncharacterized protein PAC_06616 [Phialocephala subalpina]